MSASTSAGGIWSTMRRNVRPLASTAAFVAGGFVWMSLPASASTYFQGGSLGFFVPVLAKMISCLQRQVLGGPEFLIGFPNPFHADNSHLALRRRRQLGHMLLRVNIHARNKDAIDALEVLERLALLRTAPNCLPRRLVLPHREDQRYIQRHSRRTQRFKRSQPGRRRRHFDHPIAMTRRPLLAELNVASHFFFVCQLAGGVFEQRIEFEADVPVVAARLLPHRQEHILRRSHHLIRKLPGRILGRQALLFEQLRQLRIEAPDLIRSVMMIGFEVAPEAPKARLVRTKSGPPNRAKLSSRTRRAMPAVMPLQSSPNF